MSRSSASSSRSSADSDDRRILRGTFLGDEAMNDHAAELRAADAARKRELLAALAVGPSSPILPLPARALDRILDALSLSDLLQISLVARAWYVGCAHYSQTAGATSVTRPTVDLKAQSKLELLLASNLRGLVTSLNCSRFSIDVTDPASFVSAMPPADSSLRSMCSLRTLHICLYSLRSDVTVHLPASLTELHLSLSFHTSSTKRGAPVEEGKPPPPWTGDECDQFVERTLQAVARLPKLRGLYLSVSSQSSASSNAMPAPYWLTPLRAAPALETLGFDFESFRPIAELRALPHLLQFVVPSQRENAWRDAMPKLLAPPHLLRLTQLPLRTAEISREVVPYLLTLSHSLQSLAPRHWDLVDLGWLVQFSKLTRLSFKEYTYSSGINPSINSIVSLMPRLPQITSLTIAYATFNSEHLESVLDSLPLLASLELESKSMESLAPFAWHPGLARTMTHLKLCCPRLPRDEVSHLLALRELTNLNIESSFDAPLYAKQLFPFQPPYPKRPLHWLRSFTPRSEREPVPSPPIDKAAVAAAHAAFDARVRAGKVTAAELLNGGQLSGVFRFLSSRDFSLAARSCRSWRAAAALPSAWGFSTPNSSSPSSPIGECAPPSPGWTLGLFRLLGQGVDLMPPHADRLLSFSDQSPELSTDILPQLSLWRHARGLVLHLNPQPSFSVYWSANLVAAQRHAHEAPLRALQCLSRLETLVTDWTPYTYTGGVVAAMANVGPRLRRADMASLPHECWPHLTNLQALHYHWHEATAPAPDISAMSRMHSLHTLVLRTWGGDCPGLGAALRSLSVHHSLRHLSLELKATEKANLAAAVPWPIETLLSELTGISCMSTAPTAATAATDKPEHTAEGAEHTLAAISSSAFPSRFSPAAAADASASNIFPPAGPPSLLESFSLSVDENTKLQGGASAAFPFAAVVLGLPRLKRLQLTVLIPQAAADLSSLDRVAAFFPGRRLELESLCLGIEVAWSSFESLAVFTRLTALRLMDSRACRNTEALHIHTSNMKLHSGTLPTLVRCMPRLSLLAIDGIEVPSGDLGCIASLSALKSLRLFRQEALQLADLDVLVRCSQLEELTLARLDRVPLQARTWMDAHGRRLSAESAEDSKMLAAYDEWRGACVKKASKQFCEDSEPEGDDENQQATGQEERMEQTETKEDAEAAVNSSAPTAAAGAPTAALFGDTMMDDAPPAAAAPAAAPAAAAAAAAVAAVAAAAADGLPPGAPVALVKQVSRLLVQALHTHLAARSKSAELFAATVAAHPQRDSEFADLLHLLHACCRRTKLSRLNWSPTAAILEANVAYTWTHSYVASSATGDNDNRPHEARLALERARDRVALRTLVQARKDEIDLATAAANSSSSVSGSSSSSAFAIPPPLLVEMRLAAHMPYTRMRTIHEQALCPPLTPEERALSHPTDEARTPFYPHISTRHPRRAGSKPFAHGSQLGDDDDSNIDDPQTDADKLQQEQSNLQKAKEEAVAMQAGARGPTVSACAAASSVPSPMSDE